MIDKTRDEFMTKEYTRRKKKDNVVASKIIKQGVNSVFYINIIRE